MKNLESYGVQAMSIRDLKKTEGGFWGAVVSGTVAAITGAWIAGEKIGRTLAHYY